MSVVIVVSLIVLALTARPMYKKRTAIVKTNYPTAVGPGSEFPVSFGYKCVSPPHKASSTNGFPPTLSISLSNISNDVISAIQGNSPER